MNYAEVIEFVKKKIAESERPNQYGFRNRFEHTMRVYRWAIRLQAKLGGDLDVIVLSALLHDVGWEDGRPYEDVSAEVAVEYLDSIGMDQETIRKVGEIILLNADKDTEKDLSLECKIVMDADILDEVGAIGVMWNCMAVSQEDEASYKKAYYKIKEYYRISRPKIRNCKTDAGRMEYSKRMQAVEAFIYQMEKELF